MFVGQKVTLGVNEAMQDAAAIALQYGVYQISTEHILYGIANSSSSVASKILSSFGVNALQLNKVFMKTSPKKIATILNTKIDLTDSSKEILAVAKQFANQIGQNFVGLEHLLVSLLLSEECYAVTILKKYFKVNITELKGNLLQVLKANSLGVANENAELTDENYDIENVAVLPEELVELGIDLTQKARDGKIDTIIGREEEIARIIEILCRKTKNNPVLIGEAGVGKSAVVDGLALAIVNNMVPGVLKNKIVFSLQLGNLIAGTKYRGALEEKLKQVINIIINNKDIIVFIDEIHTLVQAGTDKGEINPADMLKPYLARGEFQTIGATTTDEYKKYIEKDKALERRFQPIMVNPPSVDDTIKILKGLKPSYEKFHDVTILDEAIEAAVVLSDRYILDRNLPDKAIDLVDEASSKAKVHGVKKPESIYQLEQQILECEQAKKQALFEDNYERAGELRDQISELIDRKNEVFATFEVGYKNQNAVVNDELISQIISTWTNIPLTKITESEKDRLLKLESILHARVVGQNEAVEAVSKAIRRARIGLKDAKKPIGSFMFLGQTGVGKTELCKALAEAMFDDEKALIRFDMSEYVEKHSISRLIGAPPGYVGYDEGGQLTEKVRRQPYSVLLFDEIEKAHPDIYNILLQVLDDGRLTDSQGRLVSFKNTIIIFTSNVGVTNLPKSVFEKHYDDATASDASYEVLKSVLLAGLKAKFKPEFINRIDVTCVFHSLRFPELAQIAKIFISNLHDRLKEKGVFLKITESALKYIIDKGYDPEYGARPLRRIIEQEVENKIAEDILIGKIPSGSTIIISALDSELVLKVVL